MSTSTVCVDASFVLRMFLGPDDAEATDRWEAALAGGSRFCAPSLLGYEVTNALHRYHRAGYLSAASAEIVLDAALALPILLESGPSLYIAAMRLTGALGLPATYDAHYLGLAEQLGAELWTADAALARELDGRGPRVRLLGGTDVSDSGRRPDVEAAGETAADDVNINIVCR